MEKIDVLIFEPGIYARTARIEPTTKALMEIVGGKLDFTFPSNPFSAIVVKEEGLHEVLRCNRSMYRNSRKQDEFYRGIMVAVGYEPLSKGLVSLSPKQKAMYLSWYRKPEGKDFRTYGLEPGERLCMYRADRLKQYFVERPPKQIIVVGEYPRHITCRAVYRSGPNGEFCFSINKIDILTGDVIVGRLKTKKLLK